jgi:hypothetical protein
VALFESLGAVVTQGAGSRVRVTLNGVDSVFHEPHPGSEISKPAVRAVRQYLEDAGIEP